MRRLAAVFVLLAAAPLGSQAPSAGVENPVRTEFRIFAGAEEITHQTRLRVMPTGARDKAISVEPQPRLLTALPPGIYDAQAFRVPQGAVVSIKWAERLVIMHYPDQGGLHLEVINFEPGYGALQLRAERSPLSGYEVDVFAAGQRTTPITKPVTADDYILFVLRGGRYDIRVRHVGANEADDTHWFLDVEVPPDRTRLKQVDVTG